MQKSMAILIISFFSGIVALAQTNPCLDIKTIRTVKVPWDYSKPKSPVFDYRFKYEVVNPLSPTVIILPGGPGQGSIITSGQWPLGAVPANYNKIYIDPRSVGCNYIAESATLAPYLKTENVVNDVFLAIKSLNLRNYLIYGASYGTVVATQLVNKIEMEKFELPKALVLEGAIGKKFDNFDSYFYFHQYEWDRVLNQLHPKWKNYFQSERNETSFSKQEWAALVTADIIIGDVPEPPVNGHILVWHLNMLELYLSKKMLPTQRHYMQTILGQLKESTFPNLFFRMIGCGELWGDWYYGRSLENGRLIKTGKNVCEGIEYKNAYDANRFPVPITVPIYYFQGANDPGTPMYSALYHMAVQKKTSRQFVVVPNAAQAPLTISLRGCADEIWSSILSQRTLGREFLSCPRKALLTTKQPGQD